MDKPKKSDMGGRQDRYSEDMATRLVAAMSKLGSNRLVCNACGVSTSTLYTWLNQHPDLKVRLAIARRHFNENLDEEIISDLQKWLKLLAKNGQVTAKEVYDGAGNLEKKEFTRTSPPQWVFEKYLGGMQELESVRTLVDADWLPPELMLDIRDSID